MPETGDQTTQTKTTALPPAATLCALLLALFGVACGGGDTATGGEEAQAAAEEDGGDTTQVAAQLNWFPEPEHGGLYAAREAGFYEDAGLEVELLPGGPSVGSTQIVASGQAEFGIGDADTIAQARAEGIPVVAVAANFQTFPQILMAHADAGVEEPGDFSGRTVYVAPAANYWSYLTAEFGIEPEQVVAYSGSLGPFIDDPEAINQGYITSEPYILEEEEDLEVEPFLVSDFGYNPYVTLFTTEEMIEDDPETVRAFVESTMEGWEYFFENSEEVNTAIGEENREQSMDVMAYGTEVQEPLIMGGDAEENGVGYMSEERWSTLVDQLDRTGNFEGDVEVSELYTTEFLPGE